MIFRERFIVLIFIFSAVFLYAEDDNKYYFDLLEKVGLGEKKILLQEYRLRKINPEPYLSELYKVDDVQIKALLLQEVQPEYIAKEKWLNETPVKSLNVMQRIVLWERANKEALYCEKLKVLGMSSKWFEQADTIEKKCIYLLHAKYKSKDLLNNSVPNELRDTSIHYRLSVTENFKTDDLKFKETDSLSLSKLKLEKALSRDDYIEIAKSYDKAPGRVAKLAMKNRSEAFLFEALNSKSLLKKAEAIYELCKDKIKEDVLQKAIISGSWNERYACLKILLMHKEKINVEWLKKTWENGTLETNAFLCRFLADSQHNRLFEVLKYGLENEKNRPTLLILISMEYFKIKSHSKWLLDMTLSENYKGNTFKQALKVLYLWDEAKGEKRYAKIYKDRGYKSGGVGGEYLLPLIGKSKDSAAKAILVGHINASLKNPFLNAAVEGSGWYRDRSLGARIKKLLKADERGPVENWAIDCCEDKDTPFPEKKPSIVKVKKNLSYTRE
jgi:hypothetical protein